MTITSLPGHILYIVLHERSLLISNHCLYLSLSRERAFFGIDYVGRKLRGLVLTLYLLNHRL